MEKHGNGSLTVIAADDGFKEVIVNKEADDGYDHDEEIPAREEAGGEDVPLGREEIPARDEEMLAPNQ